MRKRIIIGIIVLLVAAGAYLVYRQVGARRRMNLATVRRGVISATVETTGRIQAARQARLSPQVSGIVQKVAAKPGDRVSQGDLLLKLSVSSLERAVRQAKLSLEIQELQLAQAKSGGDDASIAIARARLRQATVALQAAQAAYDKIAKKEGAATSVEAIALESAKVSYEIAKAEFDRAVHGAPAEEVALLTKQQDLARLALEDALERLEQANVRAPFAGTLLEVEVKENEIAHAGNPVIVLADTSTLEIVASIDEIDIGEVSVGQKVEIVLDAFPEKRLAGEITHIDPAAAPQRGSTVYEATVSFRGEGLAIRPGMGTNLTITTVERPQVLLVPSRAIQTIGRRKVVRVLEGGNVREVEVKTGLSNRVETEIISGLREGQIVRIE